MQQRGREEQVGPEARVELRGLAAESRDTDGVLEQATRVAVVTLRPGGRKLTQTLANLGLGENPADERCEARMRELGGEELEEPLELVGVATQRG